MVDDDRMVPLSWEGAGLISWPDGTHGHLDDLAEAIRRFSSASVGGRNAIMRHAYRCERCHQVVARFPDEVLDLYRSRGSAQITVAKPCGDELAAGDGLEQGEIAGVAQAQRPEAAAVIASGQGNA
jgi:hypothetical protein